MNIVFLTTAHNSLSQRAFVELVERGHRVVVVIASSEAVMIEAVEREHPDLIVAPMLKKVIPASIWQNHTCIIIHPGIKGDRGPSSLDWAILHEYEEWGVTLLQADAEMDAGPIWASRTFPMQATRRMAQSFMNTRNGESPCYKQTLKWMLALSAPRAPFPCKQQGK